MLRNAMRLLLLRFLPRRLVPFMMLVEVVLLIRRLTTDRPRPVAPRRVRLSGEPPSEAGPAT